MGYQEKFVYCENNKDTKRFLEILKEKKTDGFNIFEVLTLKRNWIARYKNLEGIIIGGTKLPFTFTNPLELENQDKIYWHQPDIGTALDNEEGAEQRASSFFGDEQEHFFNKNDILICIGGERGSIKDVYSMFGIDYIALSVMLQAYNDGNFPEEYVTDGKIDIDKARPIFKRKVAQYMFSEEENRLFDTVKTMDIDGVKNFSSIINDPSLFRHQILRA